MSPDNRRKAIPKEMGKARRALESAEVLLREAQAEGVANRAYYAAFHAARAALLTLGVQPQTHQGVNARFNMDLVVPGRIEAEYLSLLARVQTERELADYAFDAVITLDQAAAELEAARRFVERVGRFLQDGGWPTVLSD
jgi:uncharacterized protein (UPF0332 family)